MGAIPDFVRTRFAHLAGRFQLPGGPRDQHWIPQSGGADSAALAIVMTALFPDVPFQLIFTDTGVDEIGCYETLDKVEAYTGRKILRIEPERNLFELIEDWGGFLPGPNSRYCTKQLKTLPFERFMKEARQGDELIHAYIGIRADEATRLAFTSPVIETHLPFIDLDLRRGDIMRVLEESIGVPAYYRRRSRSGCETCFFQRRTELIGLMLERPEGFNRGMQCEKVPVRIVQRHTPATPLWEEAKIGANWVTFPLPSDLDADEGEVVEMRGRKPRNDSLSLFTEGARTTLFAAYELFWRPEAGVWWQRFVSYSRELASLKKQLDNHWVHRLLTSEAHGLTQDEMANECRLVIACIDLPADQVDTAKLKALPGENLYTWSDGESYQQIRHLTGWAMRSLHAEGLRQEIAKYERYRDRPWTWGYEQLEASEKALSNITGPTGEVLHLSRYVPVVKEEGELEVDERHIACPMCTLGL